VLLFYHFGNYFIYHDVRIQIWKYLNPIREKKLRDKKKLLIYPAAAGAFLAACNIDLEGGGDSGRRTSQEAQNKLEVMLNEIRTARANVDRFSETFPDLRGLITLPEQAYTDPIALAFIYPPALDRQILNSLQQNLEALQSSNNISGEQIQNAVTGIYTDLFKGVSFPDSAEEAITRFSYFGPENLVNRWKLWEGSSFKEVSNLEPGSVIDDTLRSLMDQYPVPGELDVNVRSDAAITGYDGKIKINPDYLYSDVRERLKRDLDISEEVYLNQLESAFLHEMVHSLDVIVNSKLLEHLDKDALREIYILRLKCFASVQMAARHLDEADNNVQNESSVSDLLVYNRDVVTEQNLRAAILVYPALSLRRSYIKSNETGKETPGNYFFEKLGDVEVTIDDLRSDAWRNKLAYSEDSAACIELLGFVIDLDRSRIIADLESLQSQGLGEVEFHGVLIDPNRIVLSKLANGLIDKMVRRIFDGSYKGSMDVPFLRYMCSAVSLESDVEHTAEAASTILYLKQNPGQTPSQTEQLIQALSANNPAYEYLTAVINALDNKEVGRSIQQAQYQVSRLHQLILEEKRKELLSTPAG